jgi:DNA-binding response OmpR family regulator
MKPNKKILLVEDDQNLGFVIKDNLEMKGYEVHWYQDGQQAWAAYASLLPDLCLLDIMLPKMDGLTLASKIREGDKIIPIIFLTAKSMQEDKFAGFEIGADDYITKPFSIKELLYRVEVFVKRSKILEAEDHMIVLGKFRFDPEVFKLIHEEGEIKLTRREAEILYFLYRRANAVVKREDLLLALWGEDDYFKGRSLDVFISKIRKYLSADPSIQIENVHGVGFKLKV